jgi:hypothetical protein
MIEIGWDYYRNIGERDLVSTGCLKGLEYAVWTNWDSYDLYLVGFKGEASADQRAKLEELKGFYVGRQRTSVKAWRRRIKGALFNIS